MTGHEALLAHWYGSADVAQAVIDGRLGNMDRTLARAKKLAARKTGKSAKHIEKSVKAGKMAQARRRITPDGQMVHRVVAAPAQSGSDGIVSTAMLAMPDLQRAWGKR
jgi:hypothetical protein